MEKRKEIVRSSLFESAALKERVARELDDEIARASIEIQKALKRKKKVILFGNGGSASDAQHIAAELVGRFERDRKSLPAIALVSNPSNITALGNDFGFDSIFKKQVEALADDGDVLIGISTSGNSPNIIEALRAGAEIGCFRIGLIGRDGGPMRYEVELPIVVPSERTCRIQEAHIAIGHILCNIVEENLFGESEKTKDD
ncbi:MAG: SIS domain-containing protein [Candidatus Glassbacteria bacterium]